MSYNVIKKIIIVIGDENASGSIGSIDDTSQFPNIDSSCKIINISRKPDIDSIDIEIKNAIDETGCHASLFSLGILNELKDNGFYILEINSETLKEINESEIEIRNKDLEYISNILIGTKDEQYEDGIIYKIKEKLKTYKSNEDIIEIPEISAFFYSGSIRDSNDDIENYKTNLTSFISNLNYFLTTLGLSSSFVFVENICNIISSRTICSEDSDGSSEDNNKEISFNFKDKLKNLQRTLNTENIGIWKKYFALDSINLSTSSQTITDSIKINGKTYKNFISYITSTGLEVSSGIPGFLYEDNEILQLSKNFSSFLYEDVLSISNNLLGSEIEWVSYTSEFDEAYLFKKGTGVLSVNDLIQLNPDPAEGEYFYSSSSKIEEDEEMKKFKGVPVGKAFTKTSSNTFKIELNSKTSFTHILFYNKIKNTQTDAEEMSLSAFVKMKTEQNISSKTKIKLTIRRSISGSYEVDIENFSLSDVDFNDHTSKKYNLFDVSSNKELGIIDAEDANEEAGISNVAFINKNINSWKDRSNRLTDDIKKSGDSLYINTSSNLYRDRDNAIYCPYFKFPVIKKIEGETMFDEDKKHLKMFFDARFGLLFWRLVHKESELGIKIYFSTEIDKELYFPIDYSIGSENISNLESEYKNPITKIRISIALSDLIINYSGKVFKIQKDNSGFTTGRLYTNRNGFILFPGWYELWNIAYIINENNVKFLDCSGEETDLNDFKELENCAYVENFPGPKNHDYKNIIANYLIGGITLKELLLQGASIENISIYDSAILSEDNEYKINIYPLSYKYPSKQSILKKRFENDDKYSIVRDLFLNNEGFGFRYDNKWYYSYFVHSLNELYLFDNYNHSIFYNREIPTQEESLIKILSSRGLRIGVFEGEDKTLTLKLI